MQGQARLLRGLRAAVGQGRSQAALGGGASGDGGSSGDSSGGNSAAPCRPRKEEPCLAQRLVLDAEQAEEQRQQLRRRQLLPVAQQDQRFDQRLWWREGRGGQQARGDTDRTYDAAQRGQPRLAWPTGDRAAAAMRRRSGMQRPAARRDSQAGAGGLCAAPGAAPGAAAAPAPRGACPAAPSARAQSWRCPAGSWTTPAAVGWQQAAGSAWGAQLVHAAAGRAGPAAAGCRSQSAPANANAKHPARPTTAARGGAILHLRNEVDEVAKLGAILAGLEQEQLQAGLVVAPLQLELVRVARGVALDVALRETGRCGQGGREGGGGEQGSRRQRQRRRQVGGRNACGPAPRRAILATMLHCWARPAGVETAVGRANICWPAAAARWRAAAYLQRQQIGA